MLAQLLRHLDRLHIPDCCELDTRRRRGRPCWGAPPTGRMSPATSFGSSFTTIRISRRLRISVGQVKLEPGAINPERHIVCRHPHAQGQEGLAAGYAAVADIDLWRVEGHQRKHCFERIAFPDQASVP